MKPGWLKPAQAAAYLSVSLRKIYNLKKDGVLKFYKLGGSTLLKVSDIDAAVERGLKA